MHARLGSRMAEEEFWRAYFYRCACLRAAVGMGGGSNYSLIGEPLSTPSLLPLTGKGEAEAEASEAAESLPGAAAEAAAKGKGQGPGQGVEESKRSSSASSAAAPQQPPAAAAAAAAAARGDAAKTPADGAKGGEGEDEGEEAVGDDDDLDGSLDLDGLDLGSDDEGEEGEGLLEGDALKELEAQIAAELDVEGL